MASGIPQTVRWRQHDPADLALPLAQDVDEGLAVQRQHQSSAEIGIVKWRRGVVDDQGAAASRGRSLANHLRGFLLTSSESLQSLGSLLPYMTPGHFGGVPVGKLIMNEAFIRAARADDVPAIAEIVDQAYLHYIARIGKPPGPMLDDYATRVLEGVVWVLEEGAVIAGIIVLLPTTNYLLLDNIAVSPARQGLGFGRRLLAFAEAEALRQAASPITT